MDMLNSVFDLFLKIDREKSATNKLRDLSCYLEQIKDVKALKIIRFESEPLDARLGTLYSIPKKDLSQYPKTATFFNGKSPFPPGLFPEELKQYYTLYYPFTGVSGEPGGAFLIKSASPKHLLKTMEPLLGVLASKTRDMLEIFGLKSKVVGAGADKDGAFYNIDKQSELFSPAFFAKFMDLLNIPLYVTDAGGQFVTVNTTFLKHFSYSAVSDLSSINEFFIDRDCWTESLKKIASDALNTGLTVRVRTGGGDILTVQDFSTLLGKLTIGILFDISDYLKVNEELYDSLDEQKHLMDKLLSTTGILQKTQVTAMKTLAALAEYRDRETGNHLHRICEYNRILSQKIYENQPFEFSISEDYTEDIFISGMLHDIGKVAVPDTILLKSGSLDNSEWDIMKKHTQWGWNILNQADKELGEQSFLTLSSRIALHHHERHDGTGYPDGLKGEDIPLSARVCAISDVYDALTSKRPYKEPWSHNQAVEEIVKEKGKHFDPVLTDIFLDMENQFYRIRREFPD
ncbi:MAG: HD domain-containing protein [Spirochaetales bacterium]|nr:MAG: HD domain-containing protein [Spirochaetales bacterium]